MACLLAWAPLAHRPLLAVESVLSLVSTPSSVELLSAVRVLGTNQARDSAPTLQQATNRQATGPTPPSRRKTAEMVADISLPAGALPRNVAAARAPAQAQGDRRLVGGWARTEQHWSATNLRYQPLYFEDVNLERYGYTRCRVLQPLISAARFFAAIPALPYKMALQRPRKPIYALGHARPGSRAAWYWQRLPLQARAGFVEAGVAVGLIFLIP